MYVQIFAQFLCKHLLELFTYIKVANHWKLLLYTSKWSTKYGNSDLKKQRRGASAVASTLILHLQCQHLI